MRTRSDREPYLADCGTVSTYSNVPVVLEQVKNQRVSEDFKEFTVLELRE